VEASLFQLGYHYPNDKTRYRGLLRHKLWANIRCLWVNFVRIVKHVLKKEQKPGFASEISTLFLTDSIKNRFRLLLLTVIKLEFTFESNLSLNSNR
jgi:hypothetical protein